MWKAAVYISTTVRQLVPQVLQSIELKEKDFLLDMTSSKTTESCRKNHFYSRFTILFDQCDENVAAGMAVKLFRDYNIDALIGPTTNIRN